MGDADRSALVSMYDCMARILACDEKFRSMLMAGQFAINYYSPRGQEAVAAGMAAALEPDDYLVTNYRGLHDQVAKGVPLRELWAEYLGKAAGACHGKGGGMHITYPDCGLMVTTGVVGSGLPIANGLALASQLRRDGRVTACSFGDGASNIGAFHEALNLAALWKLPVVFVCQNNRYAESTAYAKGTSVDRVAKRAAAYGIDGVTVDGNDPIAVRNAVSAAAATVRAGDGPTLVEALTFRFMGHHFGDPSAYMADGELDAAVKDDPVPRFRARLATSGEATDDELARIDAYAAQAADDAADFAMSAAYPTADAVSTGVFAEPRTPEAAR